MNDISYSNGGFKTCTEATQHRAIASEVAAPLQNHAVQPNPIIQRKPGEDEELPLQRKLINQQNSTVTAYVQTPTNTKNAAPAKTPFQAKLSVNTPGDPYEVEADAMADKVMRMVDPFLPLQKATVFNPSANPIHRKCAACEEEEHIHRKENSGAETEGGNELDNYVSTLSSSGHSLSESSRQFFEPRFGQDFSSVRVHTDSVAAKSAQSINALAYTTGNHIVFNQGQYSPGSDSGQKLMAHELTHVVQQSNKRTGIQKKEANQNDRTGKSSIPRPPAIPLASGVTLTPVTVPKNISDLLVEGKLTAIPLPPILLGQPESSGGNLENATPIPTSAGAATIANVNLTLTTLGFKSVPGGNGIGLIGTSSAGFWDWGHTAVYIRQNGIIVDVRGFNPKYTIEFLSQLNKVKAGTTSVPGHFTNDILSFLKRSARTIEYPVSFEQTQQARAGLPKTGSTIEGFAERYTARPGVKGIPGETNCVGPACNFVEQRLGGKVGTDKLGAVTETANPQTEGLQGRFMKTASGEHGTPNALPNAEGPPVTSKFPTKATFLKWGGVIFLVGGGVLAVVNTVNAPDDQKARVAATQGGGFLGGFLLGASAGLFCGPGAPVCSVVVGLVTGTVGAIAGSKAAELAYDEAIGDDTKVHEWINRHGLAGLTPQPADVKIKMILALLTGYVSSADVQAVGVICGSVKTANDAEEIRRVIEPQLASKLAFFGQRTEVYSYLSKMPR